jgi:hypothetical protein
LPDHRKRPAPPPTGRSRSCEGGGGGGGGGWATTPSVCLSHGRCRAVRQRTSRCSPAARRSACRRRCRPRTGGKLGARGAAGLAARGARLARVARLRRWWTPQATACWRELRHLRPGRGRGRRGC